MFLLVVASIARCSCISMSVIMCFCYERLADYIYLVTWFINTTTLHFTSCWLLSLMLWYHCVSVADLGGWGGPWPPRPLCKIILDTKAHYCPLIVSNTLFAVFCCFYAYSSKLFKPKSSVFACTTGAWTAKNSAKNALEGDILRSKIKQFFRKGALGE